MPIFTKKVRFYNLTATSSVEAEAIIDSGATFCQIPAEMAEQLQLVPSGSRRLRLANGQIVEYQVANALLELADMGETVATNVVIGSRGAAVLLGVLALDAFSLGIDTEGRRLIPKVADLLYQTGWPTI